MVSQNFITSADADIRVVGKYRTLAEPLLSHVGGAVTARAVPRMSVGSACLLQRF